jgi:hypothetical protein
MAIRIGERLTAARRRQFVGRETEKRLYESVVTAENPPFCVWHIYGPGGVGKTSLLHEFAAITPADKAEAVYLDARTFEATPDSLLLSLATALGVEDQAKLFDNLGQRSRRLVILLDTYELLNSLDIWLREEFLPQLPVNSLVVMAGMNAPSVGWRSDPGWLGLFKAWALRNLTPDEGRSYLSLRTVPSTEHDDILQFTHGHPLAISLVADLVEQHQTFTLDPEMVSDVMRSLLDRLTKDAPTRYHRLGIEACAMVHYMTEGLLAAMLEMKEVYEIFEWLRNLSFVDTGRWGLFPHDLVRDTITADLRWRNPDLYTELHQRARSYYHKHLQMSQGVTQRRVLADLVFLHRANAVVRPFFETQEDERIWLERARAEDVPVMLAIITQHEGKESAEIAKFWFERQPDATLVLRENQQQIAGFVMFLALHHVPTDELTRDPALLAAKSYLQRTAPLRADESAVYFRFWMDKDAYQGVSSAQSRIFLACVQHYLSTPGLAYSFFPCADPEFFSAVFAYADLQRLPEADFTVGPRRYGVYGHDWRIRTPAAWLDLLAEREVDLGGGQPGQSAPPPTRQPILVLSQPDFANAIREAMKNYTQVNELQRNPLLRSRLVIERVGNEATNATRASALQEFLRETAEQLKNSPRQNKLYRSLYHTYLQPAPTQERAAEILDLPFSTYRRHLKEGLDTIVDILWQRELGNG